MRSGFSVAAKSVFTVFSNISEILEVFASLFVQGPEGCAGAHDGL